MYFFDWQVTASDALCSVGGSGVPMRHCVSLLEAIEGLGQAGSVEQDVDVVIQRVYSIPLADSSPVSILKHRVSVRSSLAPPPAEKGQTRYHWTGLQKWLLVYHLVPKRWRNINSILSVVSDLQQYKLFFLLDLQAGFFSFKAHMFPLRDMMCLSGRSIVHGAAGPTECLCCLQPYGIVWQRTQTFLIKSSLFVSDPSQFSGKTTWSFSYLLHPQASIEVVPIQSLLGTIHELIYFMYLSKFSFRNVRIKFMPFTK